MTPFQIFAALFIHLIVPAVGVVLYALVCRHALRQGASRIFLAELFVLFFIYGGWLVVLLTALFWEWSGMASLGALFLLFVAPLILIPIAFHLYRSRQTSISHLKAFQAAIAYYPLLLLSVGAVYLLP